MAEGGTIKHRLEEATEALEKEQEKWNELQITPHGYRMGDYEFYIRCEVLALTAIVREKLGISEDELTLKLRTAVREQMETMRPAVLEQRKKQIEQQLTQGIFRPNGPGPA